MQKHVFDVSKGKIREYSSIVKTPAENIFLEEYEKTLKKK